MPRYGTAAAESRKLVTVYSGMVWTAPGRSYWLQSFWEPDDYAQVRLSEKQISVPAWIAQLIDEAKTVADRAYVEREARRQGILPSS